MSDLLNFISIVYVHRKPGSQWALEQAKFNLVNNYFLVGVTEEMEDFIYLLELSLPRYTCALEPCDRYIIILYSDLITNFLERCIPFQNIRRIDGSIFEFK